MAISRREFLSLGCAAVAAPGAMANPHGKATAGAGTLNSAVAVSAERRPPVVGTIKQLFFDNEIVEEMTGLRRVVNPATKHNGGNPVLLPDKPWESGHVWMYGSVIHNPAKKMYEMWYLCGMWPVAAKVPTSTGYDTAYAYSRDGLQWEKPLLETRPKIWRIRYLETMQGKVPYTAGAEDVQQIKKYYQNLPSCNMVLAQQQLAGVVHTPWDPDPEQQYKTAIFGGTLLTSPDGIRWRIGNTFYPGQISWFNFDLLRHLYFAYFIYPPSCVKAYDGTTRRVHGFSCSQDLVRWTGSSPEDIKIALPLSGDEIDAAYRGATVRRSAVSTVEVVMIPDERDDALVAERIARRRSTGYPDIVPEDATRLQQAHFNGLGVFPYEGVYIGFVTKFDCYARHCGQGGDIGPFQVELAFSRDLRHWRRDDRTLVIPNGPPGSFDAGSISTASQPVIVGDEVWLYYGGRPFHKGYPIQQMLDRISAYKSGNAGPSSGIGIAKWRLDGFLSFDAGSTGGTFITKPLIFAGRKLEINVDARGGSLAVEIQGGRGRPLPGYSLADCDAVSADAVHHIVSWQGKSDLTSLAGYEVVLKFVVQQAKLYAFQFIGQGPATH